MPAYVVRRLLYTIPLLLVVSVIIFLIININPGNYCTTLRLQSDALYQDCVERTGIDLPLPAQYGKWIWAALR